MFKKMVTLLRGSASAAAETLAAGNALVMLDQQIRDAAASIRSAQRALAVALAEDKLEAARLDAAAARIEGLEIRARAALLGNREDLAVLAATAIAELERDQNAGAKARAVFAQEIARLRALICDAEARFAELNRGRRLARLRAAVSRTGPGFSRATALQDAEETLALLRERQAMHAAFADIATAPGKPEDRLAEAGFGPPDGPTASSVLARLRPRAIAQS